MINKILKKHGLTMDEFHAKYPTEADFAAAHPKDFAALQKYASGGKLPESLLRARLESHMSSDEAQDYIDEYGKGGYVVTRSHDRKGKTHKVTGPDGTVKYFGDSKLGQHPNDPKRKKAFYARHAKNLKNNPYFRAFARATWAEGGYLDEYAKGGLFSSIASSLEGLGQDAKDEFKLYKKDIGDTLMGGAEVAYQAVSPLSAPLTAITGKDLSSMVGYDYQTDLGKKFDKGTDIYSKFKGNIGKTALPIAGSMVGLPPSVTRAGIEMAGQGFNSLTNRQPYAYGGELVDLEGPKHSEGGIMLTKNAEVEGGETKLGNYIYSDQLEVPGKKGVTFAKESKRIRNKYKLRKGGDIYDREQERLELMDLQDMNEEARAASEAEEAFEMAKGGWIKKATESIKRRGTEGVCTGSKFGGPTCPPGSKRYNLAKTFRKMAKARKHAEGGFIGDLYALGGDIDMFDGGGGILSGFSLNTPKLSFASDAPSITAPDSSNWNLGMFGDKSGYSLGADSIASDWAKGDWSSATDAGSGEDGSNFNWKGAAGMAAPLLLGSIGQIFGTVAQNKPLKRQLKELKESDYDKVDYGKVSYDRVNPITLDPTQSLLATDMENRLGRRNAEMAGAGNLATMMANKQMADAIAMKQKATTIGEYENANRQIQNAVAAQNAAIAQAEQEMNKKLEVEAKIDEAKNKGQYYTDIAALETAIGANRAAGWKGAFGSGSQSANNLFTNQQMLNAMMALYSNPQSQNMLKSFKLFGV